jgi:transglutaminase-like putative cysteine protease
VAAGGGPLTRRAVSLVPVAALAAVAGGTFLRVFPLHALTPVLAASVVLPILVSGLLAAGRRSLATSIAASWAAWLLVASVMLFRGTTAHGFLPTTGTMHVLVRSLADSWKAILTTVLPAPARPELLVLVDALVWVAALAGAEIALRTRAVLAPAIPALGVLVAGLVLGVDGPGSDLLLTGLFVALAGLLALVRSPAGPAWRRLLPGSPLVAAVVVATTAAAPLLPFVAAHPFDPRQLVAAPPPAARTVVSPLDQVSAWLLAPDTPLFVVGSPVAENWRLAVLDRFDGAAWSPSGRYVPTGVRVPALAQGPARGDAVDQRISIQGLRGVWLPAADRPASVEGVPVDVDVDSAVLVDLVPLRPGVRYEVRSLVPHYSEAELQNAVPASGAEAAASLALPDTGVAGPVAAQLQQTAERATAGSTFPFQQAARLADYLRTTDVYDPTALPGHGYAQLGFFLQARRGTSEQFASAFAVMARMLGLPSRVAVGFRPGRAVPGGDWQVRSGDVLAWPEVDFRGLGWVPFYPTPATGEAAGGRSGVPAGEPSARRAIDSQIAAAPPSPAAQLPPRPRPAPLAPPHSVTWWPVALAAPPAGAVVAYLALAAGLPRWRRWRRRRGTPAARIAGAWRETLDRLRDVGLAPAASLTVGEVSDLGLAAVGAAADGHLGRLSALVNAAGFAPEPPDEALAEEAWRHCERLSPLVARTAGRRRRLRRRLDPRALFGRQAGVGGWVVAPRMQAGADQATTDAGWPKTSTAPTSKQ